MPYYYVSTGEKNMMFTLRCQNEERIVIEGEGMDVIVDYYIRNLSIDKAKAVETAKALGYEVGEPRFTLQEIQRREAGIAAAEIAAANERREREERELQVAQQAEWMACLESGVWPWGKHKHKPLTHSMSYVAYWLKLETDDSFLLSLKKVLSVRFPEIVAAIELGNGNGKHFGEIKKRVKGLSATCVADFCYEGYYGWVHITKFVLDTGELVVYKGAKWLEVEFGEKVTFDATPKEHSEYEGVNQTMMLRFKIH